MSIKLFNNEISGLRLGGSNVSKVYLGSNQIWPTNCSVESSLLLHFNNYIDNTIFIDSSINDILLIPHGNVHISTEQGKFGGSGYFDGNASYVDTGTRGGELYGETEDFTIECWILPTNFNDQRVVFGSRLESPYLDDCLVMGINTSGNIFVHTNATVLITSSISVSSSLWTHIALVRNNGTFSLYINGILDGTYNGTSYVLNSLGNLFIGSEPRTEGTGSLNFLGYIDDFRIIKGQSLYTFNFSPPESALTADNYTSLLLNFDLYQNHTNDSSINSYNITVDSVINTDPKPVINNGIITFDYPGYVLCNSSNPTEFGMNDFTVETWINFAAFNGTQVFITNDNNACSHFIAITVDGNILVGHQCNGWFIVTDHDMTINTWYHIAITRKNLVTKLFINGILKASAIDNSSYSNSGGKTCVGGASWLGGNGPFIGSIDEVRIINGASIYNDNFTPPSSPLSRNTTYPKLGESSLLLHLNNNFDDSSASSLVPSPVAYGSDPAPTLTSSTSKFGGYCVQFFDHGYIDAGDPELLHFGIHDFTVECFINFNTFSNYPAIFGPNVQECGGFFVVMNPEDSTIMIGHQCNGWSLQASHTMTTGNWYHLAITRQNGTLRCFQNGILIGYSADPDDFSLSTVSCIGGALNAGNSLNGYMDEIRIIKNFALYTSDFIVPTSQFNNTICNSVSFLPYGTFLFSSCVDTDFVGTYADGIGGHYTEILSSCGCATTLDGNGNGFWNNHAYYNCQLQPNGWNGYYYYINDEQTTLDNAGIGCWNNNNYSFGNITTPGDGFDNCTGSYWLNGQATTLDQEGTGCWNEKNYSNATITNPSVQGYDSCTGKFWLDYMGIIQETTLDQNGTGWWGPGGSNQVYYIEATPTSLDNNGDGCWNGYVYYSGVISEETC